MANVSSSNGLEKYPKLRFKGFLEPWETVCLSDIATYQKERTEVTKTNYVSTENMLQNFLGLEPYLDESMIEGILFRKSDTLLANIRPYLRKTWFATENGACSTDVLAIHPTNVDPKFLYNVIAQNSFIDYVMSGAKGSKMPRGDKAHIMEYEIAIPNNVYEQNKIADFLQLISDRIEKIQQLIEHLKKYKRGVLKAILEQRLRFKRSNGENYPKWESYTISEISDCLDRRRVPITSNERIKGAYPYYGANGIQDYVADYIFDGEFVLLAEDGGHFNDFATEPIAQYVSGKIWVNNHAHILQAKCNTHFLFYALVHKDIRNYINNPSRGKLNQEDMQGIVIDVPCKEEQERIVDFLLKIDQNIEAKLNTLNQLVDFKKGLLQQLFI